MPTSAGRISLPIDLAKEREDEEEEPMKWASFAVRRRPERKFAGSLAVQRAHLAHSASSRAGRRRMLRRR